MQKLWTRKNKYYPGCRLPVISYMLWTTLWSASLMSRGGSFSRLRLSRRDKQMNIHAKKGKCLGQEPDGCTRYWLRKAMITAKVHYTNQREQCNICLMRKGEDTACYITEIVVFLHRSFSNKREACSVVCCQSDGMLRRRSCKNKQWSKE